MPRELITSSDLTDAVPYHYASAASGKTIVFTAGACPLDDEGRIVADDIPGQTRQAMANLTLALHDAGCSHTDIVKTTVFVASASRDDLLKAWDEYVKVFGTDGPPSTLLGVAVLGFPNQLVEIEATAVRD